MECFYAQGLWVWLAYSVCGLPCFFGQGFKFILNFVYFYFIPQEIKSNFFGHKLVQARQIYILEDIQGC